MCLCLCDAAIVCVVGEGVGWASSMKMLVVEVCFELVIPPLNSFPPDSAARCCESQSLHTPDPVPIGGFSFDPATRVVTTPQTRSVKMERTIGVCV
jgi:hypothetical protein